MLVLLDIVSNVCKARDQVKHLSVRVNNFESSTLYSGLIVLGIIILQFGFELHLCMKSYVLGLAISEVEK